MSEALTWSTKWSWNQKDSNGQPLTWNGLAPNPPVIMPTSTSTDTPIVVNLTPAQKTAIVAKITELAGLLDFTIGLSDDERKALLKLGEKSVGFDEKVASYMASRPDLVPGYVNLATLGQNRAARVDVADLLRQVGDVWQRLSDTDLKLGNQIYKPELAFYSSAQEAAKHGVPGAQAIVEDLKTRFVGQGRRATPVPTTKKPAA